MDMKWVDTSLNLSLSPSLNSSHKIIDEDIQKGECSGDCAKSEGQVKVLADGVNLVQELERITSENKKLTEVVAEMSEKCSELHHRLRDLTSRTSGKETSQSRKRKTDKECNHGIDMFGVNRTTECCSCVEEPCKRPKADHSRKVSRVLVRTDPSDTSQYVKDGYHWRKYGQKVTRDNPCPRAYFKCSYSPNCPMKKRVQRSLVDQSILVATYEGEHNHARPDQTEMPAGLDIIPHAISSISPAGPTVLESMFDKAFAPDFQQFLVREMATSLTKDLNFTTTLAAAISGRIMDETRS